MLNAEVRVLGCIVQDVCFQGGSEMLCHRHSRSSSLLAGRSIVRHLKLLALTASFAALAWAQSQNASISGQVTDESGAVVPNAVVTITASERNAVLKVTCDV